MKTYEVIVERSNGNYLAYIPALPNIRVEGATREEVIGNAQRAAQQYLTTVEIATLHLTENVSDLAMADEQEQERKQLIRELEQVQPQTELGAKLISLRLQMLREGRHLRSLDEINRDLGRDEDADVH